MLDLGKYLLQNWTLVLIVIFAAYLIGSLNFSIIITRFVKRGEDIRNVGSGNAGFTNMLRTSDKKSAIATLVLDLLKGMLASWLGGTIVISAFGLAPESAASFQAEIQAVGKYTAGFFCILGHVYPLYFGFKGGKGIATTAGVALAIDWRVFLISIGSFLVLLLITKIVSFSSIIAASVFAVSTFLCTYFLDYRPSLNTQSPYNFMYVTITTAYAVGIAALLIIKHRENIKRLLKGEEKKITTKK